MHTVNRRGEPLALVVDHPSQPCGLAFVVHGLGGFKEQPHIQLLAETLVAHGYTTVRYDAADTIGESGGNYEKATPTSYYHDLLDVIGWAQEQPWYREPFTLVGHSLGALCVALYAEHHPEKVRLLAPLATVVSGRLTLDTWGSAVMEEWVRTGFKVKESNSKPGVTLRLGLGFAEDCVKYDLMPRVGQLQMPILMAVGDADDSTPLDQQQQLFKALPNEDRHLHVIKGAGHTFREPAHLDELQRIVNEWLLEHPCK